MLTERGLLAAGTTEEELLFFVGRLPAMGAPESEPATIVPYRDGPYVVSGSFAMRDQDGNAIDAGRRTVALCRCGRSKLRPFCDGTHKLAGFRAVSGLEGPPMGEHAIARANGNGNGRREDDASG
jgi:CDGSH-type Zn-finger protein